MRDRFWLHYSLEQLSEQEWEALCDGCGRCCLLKLQDEDTEELVFTNLTCRCLNLDSIQCEYYEQRFEKVPDCLRVTPQLLKQQAEWLPQTCAYRRLFEGKGLAHWHPLVSGDKDSVRKACISIAGRVRSEQGVAEQDYEDYVVRWVE